MNRNLPNESPSDDGESIEQAASNLFGIDFDGSEVDIPPGIVPELDLGEDPPSAPDVAEDESSDEGLAKSAPPRPVLATREIPEDDFGAGLLGEADEPTPAAKPAWRASADVSDPSEEAPSRPKRRSRPKPKRKAVEKAAVDEEAEPAPVETALVDDEAESVESEGPDDETDDVDEFWSQLDDWDWDSSDDDSSAKADDDGPRGRRSRPSRPSRPSRESRRPRRSKEKEEAPVDGFNEGLGDEVDQPQDEVAEVVTESATSGGEEGGDDEERPKRRRRRGRRRRPRSAVAADDVPELDANAGEQDSDEDESEDGFSTGLSSAAKSDADDSDDGDSEDGDEARPRRRRRRRRRRRGSASPSESASTSRDSSDDDDPMDETSDESAVSPDDSDDDDAGDEDDVEPREYRNIPSWGDTIGVLVERSPTPGGSEPRTSSRSRGRRRRRRS